MLDTRAPLSVTSTTVFFFFQAEDGIRDIGVTGVQTCALPICDARDAQLGGAVGLALLDHGGVQVMRHGRDRKSTRLNSSHANISYAVFCLKKKRRRERGRRSVREKDRERAGGGGGLSWRGGGM